MNPPQIRWGILGAANIARKNWKAIQLAGNSTVVAVASRDLARCRQFIADCQSEAPMASVPRAHARYEDLLANDEVDAVYIPLPTGLRREWVLRAAAAGKHVVCEKPCAPTVDGLREMVDACRSRRVQFMDGVMFMHSRRLGLLRQVLDDGESVGEVRRIASAFTFRQTPEFFATNIRTHGSLEPLGCLGDLGWYCIRFILWLKDWQMPTEVTGRVHTELRRADSPAAVPTSFSGQLLFAGGVSADFHCSFLTDTEQWVRISGTKGCVQIPDFVLPTVGTEVAFDLHQSGFQVNGCDFRVTDDSRRFSVAEHSHGHASAQEANLFRNFAAQVLSGQLNPEWPEAALKSQVVTCACLDSARANGRTVQPGAGPGSDTRA